MKLLLKQGENPSEIKPKRTRPRKSRDRRLLEALLKCVTVWGDASIPSDKKQLSFNIEAFDCKYKQQLIAIKESMERKGGGK